jgi:hypothetical protein
MDEKLAIIKSLVSERELDNITKKILREKIEKTLVELSLNELSLIHNYITTIHPPQGEQNIGPYTYKCDPPGIPWQYMRN